MGKDNIVFHSEIWPAMLLGYDGKGDKGGDAGRARRAEPAARGGQLASSSRWRAASSPPRAPSSSTSATSWSATTPTRCATTSPRPARRPRTPTSPGPSSCAATTTSWSPAGATWSTARSRWRPRTSARSRPPSELTARGRGAAGGLARRLRGGRRPAGPLPASRPRSPRRCGWWPRPTSTSRTPAPWKLAKTDPERHGHRPARRAAARRRRQDAAHAVPAVLLREGLPPARRRGRLVGDAGAARGRGPGRRPGLPGADRRLRPGAGPLGVHADRGRPQLAPPTPLFKKLDPSIVDEELARLGGEAA